MLGLFANQGTLRTFLPAIRYHKCSYTQTLVANNLLIPSRLFESIPNYGENSIDITVWTV